MPVTIDEIRQAADAIAGHVIDTCAGDAASDGLSRRVERQHRRDLQQRAFTNLPVQTVEVECVLQTRSHDHVRQVIEALARKGFDATLHLE